MSVVVTSREEIWGRRSVIVGIQHENGRFSVAEGPLLLKQIGDGEIVEHPTFTGTSGVEFLQAALDHAWALGMRPKNWRLETTEQVAAMDAHLQDMRRLVFRKA